MLGRPPSSYLAVSILARVGLAIALVVHVEALMGIDITASSGCPKCQLAVPHGPLQARLTTATTRIGSRSDPNGNTTAVPSANLTFDAFNRMNGANGSTYYVNPAGAYLRN